MSWPRGTASRSGALHAPCLLLTRRIWGTDPVGKIYRAMEVAEEAGAGLVVMHPPFRWQRGYRVWLDERLRGLEERTGVVVAFENMFPVHVGGRPVTFHTNQDLDDLDRFDDLVLDTSHAAVAGHDLVEVRGRFGIGCVTSICRTTPARAGTPTCRPARAS